MGTDIIVTIDNHAVHVAEGASILSAADSAGIYIPRLCHHPDLPPGPGTRADGRVFRHSEEIRGDGAPESLTYHGCNVCLVEVEGRGLVPSCATPAEDGMVICTQTPTVKESRRTNLARLLSRHPHSCLLCSENDGCDRGTCPQGEMEQGRCCSRFGDCEFQAVCEYVTINDNVSQYMFKDLPVLDTPFFTVNPNRCIGCTRCVRACEKMQGKRVIDFTCRGGEFVLGTSGPSHRESGCVFCGACVAVCPAGAHVDKGLAWKKKENLAFTPVILPPENNREFTGENIRDVPEVNGVYQLLNEKLEVIFIRGTDNLRSDMQEMMQSVEKARFFRYEEHGMYTMRENELVEKHLKQHGTLPEVNDEISDLY